MKNFAIRKADFKRIGNEIYREEMARMEKAGDMLINEMKSELNRLGIKKQTGNLIKGLKKKRQDASVLVGAMAPAYHAHFIEFGTSERFVQNYRGHKGVVKFVGAVKATPFILPTFERKKEEVKQILSEPII